MLVVHLRRRDRARSSRVKPFKLSLPHLSFVFSQEHIGKIEGIARLFLRLLANSLWCGTILRRCLVLELIIDHRCSECRLDLNAISLFLSHLLPVFLDLSVVDEVDSVAADFALGSVAAPASSLLALIHRAVRISRVLSPLSVRVDALTFKLIGWAFIVLIQRLHVAMITFPLS